MSKKEPFLYYGLFVNFPYELYKKISDYALHNDITFSESVCKMTLYYVSKIAYTNTVEKDGALTNE